MKPVTPKVCVAPDTGDDSILRRLTREDRAKLSMDCWEPSLLRNLLRAQDKLRIEEPAEEPIDGAAAGDDVPEHA